jgi:hypothetical protein
VNGLGSISHLQVDNINLKYKGGTGRAYLRARLRRGGIEIAEGQSIWAAALAAGIITPPTPLILLRRAWKRASAEERETFVREFKETVMAILRKGKA